MNELDWALNRVAAAPKGPRVGAFFDLDGTIVKGFTAVAFFREQLTRGELSLRDVLTVSGSAVAHRLGAAPGERIIEAGVALLAGEKAEELETRAGTVFKKRTAPLIRPQARELIRAHHRAGHFVVISTAATPFQARPIAEDLNIRHVLSTELEVEGGLLTGRIAGAPLWGSRKAQAVSDFARAHDIELPVSFGYGNGDEDRDFLSAVGRPVAVSPEPVLAAFASDRGIPILPLAEPKVATPKGVMGTVGAVGAMNAAVITGWLASRSWAGGGFPTRLGWAADVTLRAAGIKVEARGAEHIEGARPAVIIFNHQSNLDPLVVGSLVRRDFTAVGKREAASDPRGLAIRLLDLALIDRSDPETARRDVAALVERVRGGESVLIAPEGTRMPTPTLGRFKFGAFNLAVGAGVPLVPIVLHNTHELWPRGSFTIRPGTVLVEVLPPVSTDGWRHEDVPIHAESMRARYAEALERSWSRSQ